MITFYNHQHKQTSKKEKEKRKKSKWDARSKSTVFSVAERCGSGSSHFDADSDPSFQIKDQICSYSMYPILACHLQIDADPDQADYFDADPDPTIKFDADPQH
jgi:hypothetical protein